MSVCVWREVGNIFLKNEQQYFFGGGGLKKGWVAR